MTAWRQAGLKWVLIENCSQKYFIWNYAIEKRSSEKILNFLKFNYSYINYSNIAARVLRQALKADLRAEAVKRDDTHIKFTPWVNGKPAREYSIN